MERERSRLSSQCLPRSLLNKCERAIQLARLMLGAGAVEQDIEDQAVALMYLPSDELAMMHARWVRLKRKPSPRKPSKRSTAGAAVRSRRGKGR